jgi:hypothetical protein
MQAQFTEAGGYDARGALGFAAARQRQAGARQAKEKNISSLSSNLYVTLIKINFFRFLILSVTFK